MTPALASAVYEGRVMHRRRSPHAHAFGHSMAQLYIDLAELPTLFDRHRLWSVDRRNACEFRRSDYLGPDEIPLEEAVRQRVQAAIGRRPAGPVRLLTHLRYFGHAFNPVSFYYCFHADGVRLDCIVAEITNTPWKERHAYVLPVEAARPRGRTLEWRFPKAFHVSPFMPMSRDYTWRFTVPGDSLHVHMDVSAGGRDEFDATLALHRRPLDGTALARVLWGYPLMTLQVVGAIHWQALRLWLKGNPVHDHPTRRNSR
ncbi:DUF1365 domain-containing protein [Lysobacter sp. A3-1-A15]|uniref:DUF1365 domain-containing protein n=1 Tax=Novilysobacter viscosus TaxID=3098602 RepID=UPI002ED80B25